MRKKVGGVWGRRVWSGRVGGGGGGGGKRIFLTKIPFFLGEGIFL